MIKILFSIVAFLLPTLICASICPAPSEIKFQDGRFVAITTDDIWKSDLLDDAPDLNDLEFWHVRGQSLDRPVPPLRVKINKVKCAYFTNNLKVIWLNSSGYPSKSYWVDRTTWVYYPDADLLTCSSLMVSDCVFN